MEKLDELQKTIAGMLNGRWVVDFNLLAEQAREAQAEAAALLAAGDAMQDAIELTLAERAIYIRKLRSAVTQWEAAKK